MHSDTQDIARLRELSERAHERLAGVSIDRMEGDNLAIVLCSHFDDGEGDNDENGWSEAATAGYDETIQAIRAHYQPVFDALLAELEAATARIGVLEEALEPFATHHPMGDMYVQFAPSLLENARRALDQSSEVK